jgi:hypothetical protein
MKTRQPANTSEILFYQADDGASRIEVRMDGETVWLTLNQMAELFRRDKSVISRHIQNVFDEGELQPTATVAKNATVQKEGNRQITRDLEFYNLDVIISVGYRVKSNRGTQFRIWATQRLKEYLVKGFSLDDERLKRAGGGGYFEELLARIRDIRSSEKVFWRKVLDIYATSMDYDPSAGISQEFFATIQNKMHWAAHGHTAAEVIAGRANAALPNMGLTNWTGRKPKKSDVAVAKNYLNAQELDALNRIVTAYLEFAELQARSRKPMYMKDWAAKMDDFLKLSDRDVLTHAGSISRDAAILKAEEEYEMFHQKELVEPTDVEKHFEEAIKTLKITSPEKTPDRKKKKRR